MNFFTTRYEEIRNVAMLIKHRLTKLREESLNDRLNSIEAKTRAIGHSLKFGITAFKTWISVFSKFLGNITSNVCSSFFVKGGIVYSSEIFFVFSAAC